MLLVSICCYKRVKAKRDRGNILVDEDVYAAESESELRETAH